MAAGAVVCDAGGELATMFGVVAFTAGAPLVGEAAKTATKLNAAMAVRRSRLDRNLKRAGAGL